MDVKAICNIFNSSLSNVDACTAAQGLSSTTIANPTKCTGGLIDMTDLKLYLNT